MTGSLPSIVVPIGSPELAAFARNIENYVQWIMRGPQFLTTYTTGPTAGTPKRALAFDETNNVPQFANKTGVWADLVASGGAASFTTVTIGSFTATQLGTTGVLLSGTYLPTLTAVTNVAASTAYNCQYIRVGNVVNVSGKLDVDPTLTGATLLGISLPIASTLSAAEKCSGVAASNSLVSESGAIDGDTVNNRAQMDWVTTSLANHSMYFDFQYLVT